jgi:hypothetical protein
MFNSAYQNFVNVRSEGNCKRSTLIRGTEFALSALYNIDFIIINLQVGIGVTLCTG